VDSAELGRWDHKNREKTRGEIRENGGTLSSLDNRLESPKAPRTRPFNGDKILGVYKDG
jgi:hypothetical protein